MNNKISQIFGSLRTERKDNVRTIIGKRYNISLDSVKNHWLLKGNTPEMYKNEVVDILKEELRKQIEEEKKMLSK